MSTRSAAQLRQDFLNYFSGHGHTVVKSSSLIPLNDPTLMFTTAGMVQFKDVFKGLETRPYNRAVTSQKCLRVSGKQNDLEEVGRTRRHHTFFEMLGNFSLGDYFKAEAIEFAWRFLTRDLGLPRDKLWLTVFGGAAGLPADDVARALWREISGLPEARILGMGMADNFWAMGDTGPCGVTSEIFYDTGSGPVSPADFESGRVVEIWNLVFMEFDRQSDGSLPPLPKPSVDTGMGIERLACVMQGALSNFHTDLFAPMLDRIGALSGKPYGRGESEDDVSMRVIADHARAVSFLVADGIQPSKEGRGYVMRRIMRRAIRHGRRLGFDEPFLHKICAVVVDSMGDAYPELRDVGVLIGKIAEQEETAFRHTLDKGLGLLAQAIEASRSAGVLPGGSVFKLYDTYGFPKDLTQTIAAEQGLGIDEDGFDREMAAQQERSRGGGIGEAEVAAVYKQVRDRLPPIRFIGYDAEDKPTDTRDGEWRLRDANGVHYIEAAVEVCAVIRDGASVDQAGGGTVEVVLQPTPFYGEAGGQVGDRGVIVGEDGLELQVLDTQKPLEDFTVTSARVASGTVRPGMRVWAGYVPAVRKLTRAHHSATHLLHASLRKVLGAHVKQAGSLVNPNRLRFDYTHFEAPNPEQLQAVEDDANDRVIANDRVETEILPFDAARRKGALALFGEKYGDIVRVISMGDSVEFCGGTHVSRTADIGMVLITQEEAIASGVRRLEAEVGGAAERTLAQTIEMLDKAAGLLSGRAVDPAGDATLKAIASAMRNAADLRQSLADTGAGVAGGEVGTTAVSVSTPSAPVAWTLAEGRRIRDLWRGLKRLTHAGNEARAVAKELSAIDRESLIDAFAGMLADNRDMEKRLERARAAALSSRAGDLIDQVREVGDLKVLTARVSGVDGKALRELGDRLRAKLGSGVVCLCSDMDGKALLLVAVSRDLTSRVSAIDLVKQFAPMIGGRGGGKPEMAQAGGTEPARAGALFEALVEQLGLTA